MKKPYFYLGVVALFFSCNDILQDGNMDGLQSTPDNGKEKRNCSESFPFHNKI